VDPLDDLLRQAESGDLRPQVNRRAIIGTLDTVRSAALSPVVGTLLRRFTALARPIGDASRGTGPELRLQDAGPYFYLVESLQRLGCAEVEQTLLILLDEFAQLEPQSYDELYLWSIVHLSRSDQRHIETFWPMVFALDVRHRAAEWKRPAGVPITEQPYHLTELVFYHYFLYTIDPRWSGAAVSLARCLLRIEPQLSRAEYDLVMQTMHDLYALEHRAECRMKYGDTLGSMGRRRR
jgi:hypothetical protein